MPSPSDETGRPEPVPDTAQFAAVSPPADDAAPSDGAPRHAARGSNAPGADEAAGISRAGWWAITIAAAVLLLIGLLLTFGPARYWTPVPLVFLGYFLISGLIGLVFWKGVRELRDSNPTLHSGNGPASPGARVAAAVGAVGVASALILLPAGLSDAPASAAPCPDGSQTCGPQPTMDPGPTQGNGGNTTAPQAPNTTVPPNTDTGLPQAPTGTSPNDGSNFHVQTPDFGTTAPPPTCIAGCDPTQAPQTGRANPPQSGQQQNPVTTAPRTPATTQIPTTTPKLRTPTPETTTSTTSSSKARNRDQQDQRDEKNRDKNSGIPYQAAWLASVGGTYRRKKLTTQALQDGQVVAEKTTQTLVRGTDTAVKMTTLDKPVQLPGGGRLPDPQPVSPAQADDLNGPDPSNTVFGRIVGRNPRTDNDYRIASALDPNNTMGKYGGTKSVVRYARINPVKGQGVVRMNLFIPGRRVVNVGSDRVGYNVGDGRDFDPRADAGDSRVSVWIDYENGLIVARQNPSAWISEAGGGGLSATRPEAGVPDVLFRQGPNGNVVVSYVAADPLQFPGLDKVGVGVKGNVWVSPNTSGPVGLSGRITEYPSAEVYQYLPDGTIYNVAQYRATGSDLGPAWHLQFGLAKSLVGSGGPAESLILGTTPLQATP